MAASPSKMPGISSRRAPMFSWPAVPYFSPGTQKRPSTHLKIRIERSLSVIVKPPLLKVVFAALLYFSLLVQPAAAQKKQAAISGKVLDENDRPLGGVSVTILGRQSGIVTSDSGEFRIRVEAGRALALVFTFTGYKPEQRNFLLNEREEEKVLIRMERGTAALRPVVVSEQQAGREAGLVRINPRDAINIP